MDRTLIFLGFLLILLFIEWYAFQAVKAICKDKSDRFKKLIYVGYSIVSVLFVSMYLYYNFGPKAEMNRIFLTFLLFSLFINVLCKTVVVLFVFASDLIRLGKWIVVKVEKKPKSTSGNAEKISRSAFLAKAGIATAAVPFVSLSWGIVSGAHDYRIKRIKLPIANLPTALEGLKIVQISDIHSGSFWNKTAVKGGVEMLQKEKADIVFFTGDLVNNKSTEMSDWGDAFSKIKAPLGVYSVLGNHDYGDYVQWPTAAAKAQNLKDLFTIEKNMGWTTLSNEHRIIEIDGEKIGIIGVDNWSAFGRFPKYGDLSKATENMEESAFNILLSHDPTHWKSEVVPQYNQIDLTLSGHTHGMQFGVEIPGFKWSPAQYLYEEWAGLYKSRNQYLYVNRGFGYIGYPGRLGILPEITSIELYQMDL